MISGFLLAAACAIAPADRVWIDRALTKWRVSERRLLKLAPSPLPRIYLIDGRCRYSAARGQRGWRGEEHGATVTLPGGSPMPIGPISFAATDTDGASFFAMSLPSVWRTAGVTSGLGLERLMDGVLLHEMMHTRQSYFVDPALAALTKQYGLPDSITDDSLQDRFGDDPAYRATYEAERDALFAAAAAPDDATARQLAAKALGLLRARRAKWFVGADIYWAQLDDIFLTMEGLGQWLAYAWTVAPFGARIAPETALEEVRRGGRHWTQDEGLALFLTIDRLLPDWQKRAFAPTPALAEALLARAVGE